MMAARPPILLQPYMTLTFDILTMKVDFSCLWPADHLCQFASKLFRLQNMLTALVTIEWIHRLKVLRQMNYYDPYELFIAIVRKAMWPISLQSSAWEEVPFLWARLSPHLHHVQGDDLSRKPRNVREFDSCQGNVRDFTKSQGSVREKSCQEKVA